METFKLEDDMSDWIDVTDKREVTPCACGEKPSVQLDMKNDIYRLMCACGVEARGRDIAEAAVKWDEQAEDGPPLPGPMPIDCPAEDKIYLRLALSEEGGLYLYDAVTGRPVAHQVGMDVAIIDQAEEIQAAVVEVYTDGRLVDEGAKKAIEKRRAQ